MLLPDSIKPEYSIYYIGSLVLNVLHSRNSFSLFELFQKINEIERISFSLFSLSLDWLFLIHAVDSNEQGDFKLCI